MSRSTDDRPQRHLGPPAGRANLFECTIAGRPVKIQRRSGPNFLGPNRAYVWCSERECQYADLNMPPCPLNPRMFENFMDTQTLLAELVRDPRQRVCYACLCERLGLSHASLRAAAAYLVNDVGAVIAPARCVVCRRRAVAIHIPGRLELSAWPRDGAPSAAPTKAGAGRQEPLADCAARVLRVREHLNGARWCAGCVAFAGDLSLTDAHRTIAGLALQGTITVDRDGRCSQCGRLQLVMTGDDGRRFPGAIATGNVDGAPGDSHAEELAR
jgi:hypothetical protein